MAIANFTRHIHIANINLKSGATVACFITVSWEDGKLSICGVEGPRSNGDCFGACGQTTDMEGWQALPGVDIKRLRQVWTEWHLNDMRAGTPAQTACLAEFFKTAKYPENQYPGQLEHLRKHGLETDGGYKYGSAWLREEVPADVVEFLHKLPSGPRKYLWKS